MKKTIIMALMAAASVSASAQQKQTIEIPSWLSNVKLSGYGMTQYQYSGQKDAESNSFNIRMAPDTSRRSDGYVGTQFKGKKAFKGKRIVRR